MSSLPRIVFDSSQLKLDLIFEHEALKDFPGVEADCEKTRAIYGEFRVPELPASRPYTFCSMVTSVDGRIAFPDEPQGPAIAQKNELDPFGAMADFWILNLLRALCDATIFGPAGLWRGDAGLEGSCHLFDVDLERMRLEKGLTPMPCNVVTSLDAGDINFAHPIFDGEIPVIINTSPRGLDAVKGSLGRKFRVVGPFETPEDVKVEDVSRSGQRGADVIDVLITGREGMTCPAAALKALKGLGMDKVLIEGPTYAHLLIQASCLDELLLNVSSVYVGGRAPMIGELGNAFTSTKHPHTRLLSLHQHAGHFLYMRHQFLY